MDPNFDGKRCLTCSTRNFRRRFITQYLQNSVQHFAVFCRCGVYIIHYNSSAHAKALSRMWSDSLVDFVAFPHTLPLLHDPIPVSHWIFKVTLNPVSAGASVAQLYSMPRPWSLRYWAENCGVETFRLAAATFTQWYQWARRRRDFFLNFTALYTVFLCNLTPPQANAFDDLSQNSPR